ncbi:hypothetical protein RhiirA5_440081 [Rhizophagus irregularis]|uniref:Uncharacterized protein n=1 Tax=Rhizophagus irregularis TaxID=588596 RepID=A0A2N0NH50_9GLOM|nr:hypothetical protein RhiirA5_440081 [Rhizophagus irregularis]
MGIQPFLTRVWNRLRMKEQYVGFERLLIIHLDGCYIVFISHAPGESCNV